MSRYGIKTTRPKYSRQRASYRFQLPSFFEGAMGESFKPDGSAPSPAYINEFVSSEDGLRLAKAFMQIENAELRHRIVNLVQEIAGSDGD